jgi:hypothetical protein
MMLALFPQEHGPDLICTCIYAVGAPLATQTRIVQRFGSDRRGPDLALAPSIRHS